MLNNLRKYLIYIILYSIFSPVIGFKACAVVHFQQTISPFLHDVAALNTENTEAYTKKHHVKVGGCTCKISLRTAS